MSAAKGAETSPDALADRFPCLEAGGLRVGMDTDALGGAVNPPAMNAATRPWPVNVAVRSVPHMVSIVTGMRVRAIVTPLYTWR